jgi:hypothetical protein
MKLLIMQSSAASCHFLPLSFKYSPQHPVLKSLNLYSSLTVRDKVSYPYKTTGKIIIYIFLYTGLSLCSGNEAEDDDPQWEPTP